MVSLKFLNLSGKSGKSGKGGDNQTSPPAKCKLLTKLLRKYQPDILVLNNSESLDYEPNLGFSGFHVFKFGRVEGETNLLAIHERVAENLTGLAPEPVEGDEVTVFGSCGSSGSHGKLNLF